MFLVSPTKDNIINIDLAYEQPTPFNLLGEKGGIYLPNFKTVRE
jgi:hypothetical protein